MREIKFRGFSISAKRWHFGFLTIYESGKCIIGGFEVYSKSIGEYTGLKDKSGKEIYEGDIVELFDFDNRAVACENGTFGYISIFDEFISFNQNKGFSWSNCKSERIKVIGNIYENPELLEA